MLILKYIFVKKVRRIQSLYETFKSSVGLYTPDELWRNQFFVKKKKKDQIDFY